LAPIFPPFLAKVSTIKFLWRFLWSVDFNNKLFLKALLVYRLMIIISFKTTEICR
jgi:hypothetical protein